MKRGLRLAAALLLLLFLTACGGSGLTAPDASDYVRGLLDVTYLGVFSEAYLESVGITEEEAQAHYEDGLEVEYAYFTTYFDMDETYLTEESQSAILQLLADLYQSSKYQVKTGTKVNNGFEVEVAVQPIDLIPLVAETYMEPYSQQFAASYAYTDQAAVDAMSAEEQEAFWTVYENRWAMGIVELFRTHQSQLGYLEAESLIVQVKPDEDGCYTLSATDFSNIDALILAYSYR